MYNIYNLSPGTLRLVIHPSRVLNVSTFPPFRIPFLSSTFAVDADRCCVHILREGLVPLESPCVCINHSRSFSSLSSESHSCFRDNSDCALVRYTVHMVIDSRTVLAIPKPCHSMARPPDPQSQVQRPRFHCSTTARLPHSVLSFTVRVISDSFCYPCGSCLYLSFPGRCLCLRVSPVIDSCGPPAVY